MTPDTESRVRALPATEAVAAVAAGRATVSAIADDALETVELFDGDIGAFRFIDPDAVRERAAALDATTVKPLGGLVLGVKDVIDTGDMPTSYGSPLFSNHEPAADSALVASCRRAGALVLGKTESTEFAMFQPTRTRNPVDLSRTPGGSSSGSAAAVAAGMVPVAFGTQTAGSVIRPAAYCGVYGFKPTRNWTSTVGVWRLTESFDTIGIFARTVADLALTYHGVRASDGSVDETMYDGSDTRPRRVVVLNTEAWANCEPEVADAMRSVTDRLRSRGWEISDLPMPVSWEQLPAIHSTVMAVEVARNLHDRLGSNAAYISASARAIVEQGDECLTSDYLDALAAAKLAREVLDSLADSTDLLLAPSALGVAPEGLAFTGDPVMCRPWTLLCTPASNVPAYRRADGLPVGVQAVGVRADDVSFMNALASLEAALADKE